MFVLYNGCFAVLDDSLRGRYGSGKELGGLAEWLKALVLKTSKGATPSRVRISHPPPLSGLGAVW